MDRKTESRRKMEKRSGRGGGEDQNEKRWKRKKKTWEGING